jgi:hypothetical protein
VLSSVSGIIALPYNQQRVPQCLLHWRFYKDRTFAGRYPRDVSMGMQGDDLEGGVPVVSYTPLISIIEGLLTFIPFVVDGPCEYRPG